MTSSFKKAAPRRTHRERSQLSSRQHLGLLEKHKDYVLRAKDHHRKEKAIKSLKQKAALKNPDEFYFGMINSKTKNGIHVEQRNQKFEHDYLKLLKTQDQNYITYQRTLNLNKIEKLKKQAFTAKNALSINDHPDVSSSTNHVIFVDDDKAVKEFDPATHLETLPELVGQKRNRLRLSTLREKEIPAIDDKAKKNMKKQKKAFDAELASRIARDTKLREVEQELTIQKNLMSKGAKKKVGEDSRGNPIYKWRHQRKR